VAKGSRLPEKAGDVRLRAGALGLGVAGEEADVSGSSTPQAPAATGPPPPSTGWWFGAVAIGWTWGLGFAAAAFGGAVGRPLHLAALLGPVVAWGGVLVTRTDPAYRRDLLRRVVDVRQVRPVGWLGVAAVGAGVPLTAAVLAAAAGREARIEPSLGAAVVVAAVAFAIAAGLAEEPGWRGVAHDSTVQSLGLVRSALVLGVMWSAWHLPLYFIEGTYQHGLGVGTSEFWISMLVRVPFAVLLVWLVVGTRGAVVAAVVAHALGNTVGEVLATGRTAMAAELVLMSLAAAMVLVGWLRHPAETRRP
jgi:uncharacterized protein